MSILITGTAKDWTRPLRRSVVSDQTYLKEQSACRIWEALLFLCPHFVVANSPVHLNDSMACPLSHSSEEVQESLDSKVTTPCKQLSLIFKAWISTHWFSAHIRWVACCNGRFEMFVVSVGDAASGLEFSCQTMKAIHCPHTTAKLSMCFG